jgi:hypothetical protein
MVNSPSATTGLHYGSTTNSSRVLEIAPNPCRVSKFIVMVIKNQIPAFDIHNHGYQKNYMPILDCFEKIKYPAKTVGPWVLLEMSLARLHLT